MTLIRGPSNEKTNRETEENRGGRRMKKWNYGESFCRQTDCRFEKMLILGLETNPLEDRDM